MAGNKKTAVRAAASGKATNDSKHSIPDNGDNGNEKGNSGKPTQAEILMGFVQATGADFFQSDTGDLYASVPVVTHIEIWRLDSKDFQTWLARLYWCETQKACGNEAIGQVLSLLQAKARFDKPIPIKMYTRVAGQGNEFWYDLSNATWQAIKITPQGWATTDNPPLMFVRYKHQQAQVIPQAGGDIRKIYHYIPVKRGKMLFLCWLVSCFVPNIPHPAPIFFGEKGSGKSTACERLKSLNDPSALETLTLQNDPRTLAVNLLQHWFLPFDNVSYINEETSDTLCRAITGGGIQQRKLHTNADDVIFTFKRCIAINGINNAVQRPDLLDRSILIELERITEANRKEAAELQTAFEADKPAILGGIFDTLVKAMNIFPTVKLNHLPRMADFTRWAYAIAEACGAGLGDTFLDEYAENRRSQNTEAIAADPVATLIVAFMQDRTTWDDTVSELLKEIRNIAFKHGINSNTKGLPEKPNSLSRRLRGIKSNLEAVGITFQKREVASGTFITLNKQNISPQPPHRHEVIQNNGDNGNSGDDWSAFGELVQGGIDNPFI